MHGDSSCFEHALKPLLGLMQQECFVLTILFQISTTISQQLPHEVMTRHETGRSGYKMRHLATDS